MPVENKPLIFACAGCSFAGQLAYRLALELDRQGIAEMSCLAGVGAQKKVFLKKLEKHEVWIVDGCPIECSRGVLNVVAHQPARHIRLHELGFKKQAAPEGGVNMDALVKQVLIENTSKNEQAAPDAGDMEAASESKESI